MQTFGVILKKTSFDGKTTFFAMEDTTHPTEELAFVESHGHIKYEQINPKEDSDIVMGIFCMDGEGRFITYMTRRQIEDAIESGEQDLARVEDSEKNYGSYSEQHRQRAYDVEA